MQTEIILPFPPQRLNPNRARGLHYMTRANQARNYRTDCSWAAKAVWGNREPMTPPVTMAVTFIVPDRRRRDDDNLIAAFKPGRDGLVDAGVLSGDHYQGLTVTYTVEQGESFAVRVEL